MTRIWPETCVCEELVSFYTHLLSSYLALSASLCYHAVLAVSLNCVGQAAVTAALGSSCGPSVRVVLSSVRAGSVVCDFVVHSEQLGMVRATTTRVCSDTSDFDLCR